LRHLVADVPLVLDDLLREVQGRGDPGIGGVGGVRGLQLRGRQAEHPADDGVRRQAVLARVAVGDRQGQLIAELGAENPVAQVLKRLPSNQLAPLVAI
jgi:hypothetical protein